MDGQDIPLTVGSFHVSDNGLVCAVPPCSCETPRTAAIIAKLCEDSAGPWGM